MIEKKNAVIIRDQALKAIRELSMTLSLAQGKCPANDFERMKKAVGLSIGKIQTDILDLINGYYPELDDLKGK